MQITLYGILSESVSCCSYTRYTVEILTMSALVAILIDMRNVVQPLRSWIVLPVKEVNLEALKAAHRDGTLQQSFPCSVSHTAS